MKFDVDDLKSIYEKMDALNALAAAERGLFAAAARQVKQEAQTVNAVFRGIAETPKGSPYAKIQIEKSVGWDDVKVWKEYVEAPEKLEELLNRHAPEKYKDRILVGGVEVREQYRDYNIIIVIEFAD